MFPNGRVGAGLLIIRIVGALATVSGLELLAPIPLWAAIAVFVLAGGLIAGAFTRLAALLSAVFAWVVCWNAAGDLQWVAALTGGQLAALMLTGPGAHSVDARLFGRRVMKLETPEPSPDA